MRIWRKTKHKNIKNIFSTI